MHDTLTCIKLNKEPTVHGVSGQGQGTDVHDD